MRKGHKVSRDDSQYVQVQVEEVEDGEEHSDQRVTVGEQAPPHADAQEKVLDHRVAHEDEKENASSRHRQEHNDPPLGFVRQVLQRALRRSDIDVEVERRHDAEHFDDKRRPLMEKETVQKPERRKQHNR